MKGFQLTFELADFLQMPCDLIGELFFQLLRSLPLGIEVSTELFDGGIPLGKAQLHGLMLTIALISDLLTLVVEIAEFLLGLFEHFLQLCVFALLFAEARLQLGPQKTNRDFALLDAL